MPQKKLNIPQLKRIYYKLSFYDAKEKYFTDKKELFFKNYQLILIIIKQTKYFTTQSKCYKLSIFLRKRKCYNLVILRGKRKCYKLGILQRKKKVSILPYEQ